MTYQITKRIEFDAGHRVLGHEGKCANLHGHRYASEITVQANELDSIDRVVDFSCIKDKVGGWIDANWDHTTLLNQDDPLITTHLKWKDLREVFPNKDPYIMQKGENPTAEVMARELWTIASGLLKPFGVEVINVRIFETPSCWADFGRVD